MQISAFKNLSISASQLFLILYKKIVCKYDIRLHPFYIFVYKFWQFVKLQKSQNLLTVQVLKYL